jgi:hypothetical protein
MRTVVISDLHLGSKTQGDVLRREVPRAALLERLAGVDRLVLLGDTLELRHGPAREALEIARPALQAMGEALGDAAEVLLLPGNHDHRIARDWLEDRGLDQPPPPLGLEERVTPEAASPAAAQMAQWLAPGRTTVAYPGVWLRDDVYAMHGHYGDPHTTVPTFERLAAGAMARVFTGVPGDRATPDDYERVLAPLYALQHSLAERVAPEAATGPSSASVGAWEMLSGDGHRPWKGTLLAGALPIGIGLVNRLGLGPVKADLSPAELRRSGVRATVEACHRLRVQAEHVICGHTHRAGPFSFDDPQEWALDDGGTLTNSGCWVYEDIFVRDGAASPYWPGCLVELDDEGPPRLVRVLADLPAQELSPPASAPDPA